ncbi:hypothetical protein [Nocardia carnea]|nr:hypothetical protein [Nocardia carnea]
MGRDSIYPHRNLDAAENIESWNSKAADRVPTRTSKARTTEN